MRRTLGALAGAALLLGGAPGCGAPAQLRYEERLERTSAPAAHAVHGFLAERYPATRLAPALGHDDRARYLQWMAYLTNTLQEALMQYWYPHYFVDGEAEQKKVKAKAEERLGKMLAFLDKELAAKGPHLCGDAFYACDYYLAMLIRWSRNFAKPGHSYPDLNKLVRAALSRPAYAQMLKDQGLEQPV